MRKWVLLGFLVIFTLVWTVPATADELENAQQQKNYLENKANTLARQKQQQQQQLNQVKNQTKALITTQQQEKKKYDELVKQIKALDEEILDIDSVLKDAEDKFDKQKEMLKTRLKVMYENSNNSYIKAIVESDNIIEMYSKLKYISMVSKRDKELVEALNAAKVDVEYKRKLKEDEKYKRQKEIADKKAKLSTLQVSRAANEQKEKELQSRINQLESQIDQANREAEEMTALIRSIKAKHKGKYSGSMQWPTPGYGGISSPYGWRMHPILKKNKFHSGIDINAKSGAAIVAASNGTVVLAGWQSGYGYTVVIDHGSGMSTLYAHCSKLLVGVGDEVSAGQTIAKVGSTGLSTGPHLHFEVRKDGETQNPEDYVSP